MSLDRMTEQSNECRPHRTGAEGGDWQKLGARIRQAALAAAALHICRDAWISRDAAGDALQGKRTNAA